MERLVANNITKRPATNDIFCLPSLLKMPFKEKLTLHQYCYFFADLKIIFFFKKIFNFGWQIAYS